MGLLRLQILHWTRYAAKLLTPNGKSFLAKSSSLQVSSVIRVIRTAFKSAWRRNQINQH